MLKKVGVEVPKNGNGHANGSLNQKEVDKIVSSDPEFKGYVVAKLEDTSNLLRDGLKDGKESLEKHTSKDDERFDWVFDKIDTVAEQVEDGFKKIADNAAQVKKELAEKEANVAKVALEVKVKDSGAQ